MKRKKGTKQSPTLSRSILTDNSYQFAIEKLHIINPKVTNDYHFHDVYEVYYLYEGERYYFVENKNYHIKNGTLVLIKPYTTHCTLNSANYGYDRCLLHFTENHLANLAQISGCNTLYDCFKKDIHTIKLDTHEQHYIENILSFTAESFAAGDKESEILFNTALIQLLLIANRHKDEKSNCEINYFNAAHKTLTEINAYINGNFSDSITLDSVSQKFFISTSHLVHMFKKNTGFTFIEYLNNVRTKEAQKLLVQTDTSIADIAETVGYKSNTHFTRTFKSITGISPLAYRNEYKKRKTNAEKV